MFGKITLTLSTFFREHVRFTSNFSKPVIFIPYYCTSLVIMLCNFAFDADDEVANTECEGLSREVRDCNMGLCDRWSNWIEYGKCNGKCGSTGSISISR